MKVTLVQQGQERSIDVAEGQTIAAAALEAGVSLYGSCGGNGTCCGCSRRFRSGMDQLFNVKTGKPHEVREGYAPYAKTCAMTPQGENVVIEIDRSARLTA